MRALIAAICVFLFVFAASGCGQTGPLYLPEKEQQRAPEQAPEAEPQTAQ